MKDIVEYEGPNTVSGLVAKHAELSALRYRYKAEIKKLTVDIDHLDASIRLFDPDADSYAIKGYVIKHRAQKGSVKKFVLTCLREATEPLTSRIITEQWAAERGLVCDDATYTILRKRIGACIKGCRDQGLIEDQGWTRDHDGNGPYKAVGIEKGRPVRSPFVVALGCREVSRKAVSRRDFRVSLPLHYISDTTKVEACIVSRNPRVRDVLGAGQFDYRNHIRREFTILH